MAGGSPVLKSGSRISGLRPAERRWSSGNIRTDSRDQRSPTPGPQRCRVADGEPPRHFAPARRSGLGRFGASARSVPRRSSRTDGEPATIKSTIWRPRGAVSRPLFRRANLRKRYPTDGGQARPVQWREGLMPVNSRPRSGCGPFPTLHHDPPSSPSPGRSASSVPARAYAMSAAPRWCSAAYSARRLLLTDDAQHLQRAASFTRLCSSASSPSAARTAARPANRCPNACRCRAD